MPRPNSSPVAPFWLLACLLPWPAAAENKSAVEPQVLSLPSGPGSIEGLGESFEPELGTGTAAYRVTLDLPPGIAGQTPRLALVYNSGYGNGPLGLGWRLDLPTIQRQTDKGLPGYTDADPFIHSAVGELVPVGDGRYRAKIEGAFLRIERSGDGWEVREPNGTRHLFGVDAEARQDNALGSFRWYPQRSLDTNGNVIEYRYDQGQGQVYLTEVRYALAGETVFKSVHFTYDDRPDPVSDYRSRARVVTARRLAAVEVRSQGVPVRGWRLDYAAPRGLSLLVAITRLGSDGGELPPMTFDYSGFDLTQAEGIPITDPPPAGLTLDNPNLDLIDIDGDGLPDLVHTDPLTGTHRFYLGRGGGQLAPEPVAPAASPPRYLQSNGVMMADMDGDGLSDLFVKGLAVFGWYRNRGQLAWEESDWIDASPVPGFSFEDANVRLLDLNNDKLIDVLRDGGDGYQVWLNPGDGAWSGSFDAETWLRGGAHLALDSPATKLGDMNGDRMQDLVFVVDGYVAWFPARGLGEYDGEQPMADPPEGVAPEDLTLTDIDNDGLADLVQVGNSWVRVWRNGGSGAFEPPILLEDTPALSARGAFRVADLDADGIRDLLITDPEAAAPFQVVRFNGGGHPNLLTGIHNGLGKTIQIEYRSSIDDYLRDRDAGLPWTRKLPFPVPVVGRVTVHDGNSGQQYVTDYQYRDGYYDGVEKEFRGFAEVTRIEHGEATAPTLVSRFRLDVGDLEESRKGMVLTETTLTEAGRIAPPAGLFEQAEHQLATRTLATGGDGRAVRYSFRSATERFVYEGGATPVHLQRLWERDDYGNLTLDLDYGILDADLPGADQDDLLIETDYLLDLERWIIDRPSQVRKTRLDGRFVSLRRLTYDANGNLIGDERSPDGSRFIAVATNAYDGQGNIARITDANGHWRALAYDPIFHAFPVQETIGGLDLSMAADYDLGLGLMTGFTDPNGQRTGFGYDEFGRLARIIKPGDSEDLPTQAFDYQLGDPVSAIVTCGREVSGELGTYDTVAYFDGLGRKLQTRSEGEDGHWIVAEAAIFNQRQGIARQWLPHFAATSDYRVPDLELPAVTFSYDALGRSIRETNPDGTVRTLSYRPLTRIERDEEDNLPGGAHADTPKTLIQDGRDRLVEVREQNGEDIYVTRYRYDGQDNLTRIEDDQGNIKTLTFDGLGRKTAMDDPDKGVMTYVYDDAGNLLETTDAKGQRLAYSYDAANRTLTEDSAGGGGVQVRYHYDADRPADPAPLDNTLGRLAWVEDQTGRLLYSYDTRGNLVAQSRRLNGLDFISRMDYDALARLTRLTYPDGSSVDYRYNAMGQLESIPGYVDAIDYAPTGQKAALRYANGVASRYDYDARQRLSRLYTESPTGLILQDLAYSYDAASNITRIADQRPVKTPEDRGADYGYDDLYRLTAATAADWSRTYAYDSIGNMTYKSDLGAMTYGADAGPHALTAAAGIDYQYDANGNLAAKQGFAYRFDHRDRLAQVDRAPDAERPAAVIDYAYDFGFDRKRKTVTVDGESETSLYVDRYTELRGERFIKQVFAGERLIARVSVEPFHPTMLAGWTAPETNPDLDTDPSDGVVTLKEIAAYGGNPSVVESNDAIAGLCLYTESRESDSGRVSFSTLAAAIHALGNLPEAPLQHAVVHIPDHLGSASIVADAEGATLDESAFYPYGKDRVQIEKHASDYRFAGKELDEQTGLHYFGARYYDSEIGRFVSPDPLTSNEKGMPWNDMALQAYSHAMGNPIRFSDPLGLSIKDEVLTIVIDESAQYLTDGASCAGTQLDCRGMSWQDVKGFSDSDMNNWRTKFHTWTTWRHDNRVVGGWQELDRNVKVHGELGLLSLLAPPDQQALRDLAGGDATTIAKEKGKDVLLGVTFLGMSWAGMEEQKVKAVASSFKVVRTGLDASADAVVSGARYLDRKSDSVQGYVREKAITLAVDGAVSLFYLLDK